MPCSRTKMANGSDGETLFLALIFRIIPDNIFPALYQKKDIRLANPASLSAVNMPVS
jgi:hypothetical protein